MESPRAEWAFRSFHIKLSLALINCEEREGVKSSPLAVTVPTYDDQLLVEQFQPRLVQGIPGFPPPLFHDGPCHAQITVVKPPELRQEVVQQLHSMS